ncbi:sulfur oxidation c-type cytochrome SoxX [Sulfurimonas indica]|uniref:sulfur oxidation c-type cytochrome SoxX n=1 Tax=Sulfurimonas indica TaxID=2508707 RepID=UPI00126580D6|nr:sulfur oxidation c-type cytochrome SoxX [Sulfurimonas indica]
MNKTVMMSLLVGASLFATDYSKVIEHPDASKMIEKDLLAPPKVFTMPAGCITSDPAAIARGEYIFNNLNGKKAKKNPPKGLSRKQMKPGKTYMSGDKIPPKQYGNCVACHNIEGARGAGNIGPDLTDYKENFIDSGARDYQFVFQKIADARIDNPDTHMTINLTTKLFTPREICDITSFVVAPK